MAEHTYSNITLDCEHGNATHSVLDVCLEVALVSYLSSSIKSILLSTNDYYNYDSDELDMSIVEEELFAHKMSQQTDDNAIQEIILAPYN